MAPTEHSNIFAYFRPTINIINAQLNRLFFEQSIKKIGKK